VQVEHYFMADLDQLGAQSVPYHSSAKSSDFHLFCFPVLQEVMTSGGLALSANSSVIAVSILAKLHSLDERSRQARTLLLTN